MISCIPPPRDWLPHLGHLREGNQSQSIPSGGNVCDKFPSCFKETEAFYLSQATTEDVAYAYSKYKHTVSK